MITTKLFIVMIANGLAARASESELANWLTFISSMTGFIVWPLAVIIGLSLFRKPITTVIEGVGSLELFGGKVKIGRAVEQAAVSTEAAIADLPPQQSAGASDEHAISDNPWLNVLSESPSLAAIHAWAGLEKSLTNLARSTGLNLKPATNVSALLAALNRLELVNGEFVTAASELRSIRNRVAHGRASLSYSEGLAFVNSAWQLERASNAILGLRGFRAQHLDIPNSSD